MKRLNAIVRLPDGGRVKVTATIITRESRDGDLTVDHQPAPEFYQKVSFEGAAYYKGAREWHAGGQVWDCLPDGHPIRLLWSRWHLNHMRSHCIHQDPAVPWDQVEPCPETGYRCGTKWLIEPLPETVAAEIVAAMSTTVEAVTA